MKPITTNGLVSKGRCLICRPLESCFPLHQAIILRLPIDAIDALSCPIALAEQCNGLTALHLALRHISAKEPDASWEVVKLLLEKHPKAAREKDGDMNTPLHLIAQQKAPLDLLSLFLRSWPDATKEQDKDGNTPLHYACANGALWREERNDPGHLHMAHSDGALPDAVSLLLNSWPDAMTEKNKRGQTPLHYACIRDVPLEAIIP
eukprot:15335253-Ditylum_brightwellii.AAC.1